MDARIQARKITKLIQYADKKLRRRYPVLNRQNLMGLAIFLYSTVGVVVNGFLYIRGILPAWMCIVGTAFMMSLLHELEHDLIHKLYFKSKPVIHNIMMGGVWLFRANTINPWFRRGIHLLHHRESGQPGDIEERLVGNGMRWGIKRFLLTVDPLMALFQFRTLKREAPNFSVFRTFMAGQPSIPLFDAILYSFIAAGFWGWISGKALFPAWYMHLIAVAMVTYVAPNILRVVSLHFVTASCHYYGDIDKGDLIKQTQVLNPWYLAPFQLFCFNFGSTHGIHHFVVSQPFYLRQMVAKTAHKAMAKYGVRFNDMANVLRANRYEG